jgi:hypothetical protein
MENKDEWQKLQDFQKARDEFVNIVIGILAEPLVPFIRKLNTALMRVNNWPIFSGNSGIGPNLDGTDTHQNLDRK